MSNDLKLKRGAKLFKNNPALRKPNWLPQGVTPELDELRDRHAKLIAAHLDAIEVGSNLRQGYEAEDDARRDALAAGEKPPTTTSEVDRQAALNDIDTRTTAARQALTLFLAEAVELIQAKKDDWLAGFAKADARAEEKRAEALRLLEEADQSQWTTNRARMWIERTAKGREMLHVAFEDLAKPMPSEPSLDLEQLAGRA